MSGERFLGEIREAEAADEVRVAKIKDEYEIERKRREQTLQKEMQLDRMQLLREMEAMSRERDEFEANLLLKTETQRHQQQIDLLNTKTTLSTEVLIATADKDNATILGNVEMSKHESQSKIHEAIAQRERELQDQRLQDAKDGNAATLDTIKQITSQAFGAMGQVAGRPVAGSADPNAPKVICNSCRAENQSTAKFCSNCGKGF